MSENIDQPSYPFQRYGDPFVGEAVNNGVNPTNPIKGVQVEYKDPRVNSILKHFLLKDLTSITKIGQINKSLGDLNSKLQKSGIYKSVNVNFEPGLFPDTIKIVIEPESKRRISGSFDQQISRAGSYVQEGKLVIRNVLGFLDHLTIEASKGYGGNLLESYHLKYALPVFYKDYSAELSLEKAFRDLVPTVREEAMGKTLTFFKENMYFKFSDTLKMNYIDLVQHSKESLQHEILPLRRIGFKVGKIWNDIYEIDKEYGQRTEVSGELGAGKGGAPFARVEFNNHRFINPKAFEYKKKIKNMNFENYFNCGVTLPLTQARLRLNDRFFTYNVRGFSEVANIESLYDRALHPLAGSQGYERIGEYTGDDAYVKNTIKLNFNNFPHLKEAGAVPFIYYSFAYMTGAVMNRRFVPESKPFNLLEDLKENSRHGFGVGLAKGFGPVKLELLLNMFAKGKITDRFARFQLRISSTD